MAAACCSADFTGTAPIEGCAAATLIAAAHGSGLWPARGQALLRSFLLRLTIACPGEGRGLDVLWRDQAHAVPKRPQCAAPVVRAAARFQRHLDRRQPFKEGQQLAPP
jgi:hypothetical protein